MLIYCRVAGHVVRPATTPAKFDGNLPTCSAAKSRPRLGSASRPRLLCWLYGAELSAISNSYALKSTFVTDGMNSSGLIMSVVPADEPSTASRATPKPERSWQRLSRAIDAYLAERVKKAIPAITLRRSRHEIMRCRRLMHRRVAVPVDTSRGRQTRS
jgi:hypothetical protein